MKVLVFPYDPNPYQELLYRELTIKKAFLLKSLNNIRILQLILMIPFTIVYKFRDYKVFHIHWLYTFSYTTKLLPIEITQKLMERYFLMYIDIVCILGFKLIWTAHNIQPHNSIFCNQKKTMEKFYGKCDMIICHTEQAKQELKSLGVIEGKIIVIPHGNYIKWYENHITKVEARKKLAINKEEFVYLFLGNIRGYKGIDHLLESFLELSKTYRDMTLMIAGKIHEPAIINTIDGYRQLLLNKLKYCNEYIADDNIQTFMNAADIIVLPFKQITTSGSLLLAFSFGKAVICAKNTAFSHIPPRTCLFFEPSVKNDLQDKMASIYRDQTKIVELEHNAYKFALTLNWKTIAMDTMNVYISCLGRKTSLQD